MSSNISAPQTKHGSITTYCIHALGFVVNHLIHQDDLYLSMLPWADGVSHGYPGPAPGVFYSLAKHEAAQRGNRRHGALHQRRGGKPWKAWKRWCAPNQELPEGSNRRSSVVVQDVQNLRFFGWFNQIIHLVKLVFGVYGGWIAWSYKEMVQSGPGGI